MAPSDYYFYNTGDADMNARLADPATAPYVIQSWGWGPDSGASYSFDQNAYGAGTYAGQVPVRYWDAGTIAADTNNADMGFVNYGNYLTTNTQDPNLNGATAYFNQDAYNRGFTMEGWNDYNIPSGGPGGGVNYMNQLGQAMGLTPNQVWNLYNTAVGGEQHSNPYHMQSLGVSALLGQRPDLAAQYSGVVPMLDQQAADWVAAQQDGFDWTWAMLLAGAAGAGALGLLGTGVSPAAAGAMGIEGVGAGGLGASTAMDLAGIGAAMDSSVVGSAVPGFDLAGAGMFPVSSAGGVTGATGGATAAAGDLGGVAAGGIDPASAAGAMGGAGDVTAGAGYGWTPLTGYNQLGGTLQTLGLGTGTPSNPLSSIQNLLGGGGGSSPTSGLSNLVSGLTGGGGTGTGATGQGGNGILNWLTGNGTGSLTNLVSGIMTDNAYSDQGDFLRSQMDRAWGMADPYGYGPYRQYAADQLQRTYTDPLSIYNSPEMQAFDRELQNTQLARDSASGQLFNAPERLSQRQDNFLTQLGEYRKPLMQMSGSQFRPDATAAVSLANPIVANELARNMNQGATVQQGASLLNQLLGGGGSGGGGSGTFGTGAVQNLGNLATSLNNINWGNVFGQPLGAGSATEGWTMQDTNIWNELGNLGGAWGY